MDDYPMIPVLRPSFGFNETGRSDRLLCMRKLRPE